MIAAATSSPAKRLELLVALGEPPQLGVGELHQVRLAGADHLGDRRVGIGAHRKALAHLGGALTEHRVAVRDRDPLDQAAAGRDLDRAPVGELRDQQLRDPLERRVVVGRVRDQLAGARQQAVGELRPLHVGDVLDRGHRVEHLARGPLDRPRLGPGPALAPGRACPPCAGSAGSADPPVSAARAGERLGGDLVAGLVADLEALADRLGRGRRPPPRRSRSRACARPPGWRRRARRRGRGSRPPRRGSTSPCPSAARRSRGRRTGRRCRARGRSGWRGSGRSGRPRRCSGAPTRR